MATTRLVLANRPFAVKYILTDAMMPDGIFDTALCLQRITAFVARVFFFRFHPFDSIPD